MTTLSADVTTKMLEYVDSLVNVGMYKSRSEVIREALREMMEAHALEKRDYLRWNAEKEEKEVKEQICYLTNKGLI